MTFLTVDGEDMAAYIENQKLIVKKSDGTTFREIQLRDGYYGHTVVEIFADKVIRVRMRKQENNEIIRHDYYNIEDGSDITDKMIYNNKYPGYFEQNSNGYMLVLYYVDKEEIVRYFDNDFNLITDVDESLKASFKFNSRGSNSVAYDTTPSYKTEGNIFSYLRNRINMQDGYVASYYGLLKGQKVYYATKNENNVVSNAICDEDGNVILNNANNYRSCIADKIITSIKNAEGQKEFHIMKALLPSETGIVNIKSDNNNNLVADVEAKNLDPIEIKDSTGKSLIYDELDEDAKNVYSQKFNFSIKAANGVIDDNSTLSLTKVLAGSDYEAAKEVTKDAASHIAVFNIDLLKDGAKIQPNGNIEFTVDVPNNFNNDLIAVYRLSSDGTSYVKLTSSVKDGKVTFVTDHFSTYIIAEEKQVINSDDNNNNAGNEDNNANNNTSNNEDSNTDNGNTDNSNTAADNEQASNAEVSNTTPTTGDTTNYIIYIAVLLCAAAVVVVAMTSKKRVK